MVALRVVAGHLERVEGGDDDSCVAFFFAMGGVVRVFPLRTPLYLLVCFYYCMSLLPFRRYTFRAMRRSTAVERHILHREESLSLFL